MQDASTLSEQILENLADAAIYADRTGSIERWNQACVNIFGFSKSEALGRRLDPIIPEHLRAAHWPGFDAAIANGATRLHAGRR